ESMLREMGAAFAHFGAMQWHAAPLLASAVVSGNAARAVTNPADRRDTVGHVTEADLQDVDNALSMAQSFAFDWQSTESTARAARLVRAAELFEEHAFELMALAVREAGKSVPNAIAEVREAVDFLRYYAAQIRHEPNALALGPVVCISPWNFP